MENLYFTEAEINERIVDRHHAHDTYRVLRREDASRMLEALGAQDGAFVVCAVYPAHMQNGSFYLSPVVALDNEAAAVYGVANKLNEMQSALVGAHHDAERYRAIAYGHQPFARELDDLRRWKSAMQSQVYEAVLQFVDEHDLKEATRLDALRERAYTGKLEEGDIERIEQITSSSDVEERDDEFVEHLRELRCGERMDYEALLYLAALCDWKDGQSPKPPIAQRCLRYRKALAAIERGDGDAREIARKALRARVSTLSAAKRGAR